MTTTNKTTTATRQADDSRPTTYSGEAFDRLQARASALCAERGHEHAGYCAESIEDADPRCICSHRRSQHTAGASGHGCSMCGASCKACRPMWLR
ncbi:MAG: hypothetical protein Q8S13_05550 [Dehalococcoidia bacterium]|nr:hypothetical protein [Dehalococcoidia bacterium]